MRVALDVSAIPAQPVGAGTYVVNLARALNTTSIALHLVARRDDGERWRAYAPNATVHAVAPNQRPARLAWEQTAAPSLARRIAADVWHGPHYTLPLRIGVPAVVTVHDTTLFEHPEWHERSKVVFFRPMTRAALRRAREVIAVSAFTQRRIEAIMSPRVPVTTIAHGVDHERFTPIATTDDFALLAHHGVRPPFVAFAGTIEPRKNVPALVDAFARVASASPELRLVLAGRDGWGTEAVRDAIATSGVATRVMRLGYIPAELVPALFRCAEVVCYPALVEGFGLPALEALACGAPLITTKGSAMEDVVGDAAVLVPPGNTDALADALGALLADPVERNRLRTLGPPTARPFTWDACAAGHLAVYERAAS